MLKNKVLWQKILERHGDSLEEALEQFVNELGNNGIKQGSEEWLAAKDGVVGGTRMTIVSGENKFTTVPLTIKESISGKKLSNPAMGFGSLFEPMGKAYVEQDKGCKIHGDRLFVLGPHSTAYSPDGLFVMDDEIYLFELKCPEKRVPDGRVPKYYLPQPLLGLEVLDIANKCLFAQCVFKPCPFGEWEKADPQAHPKLRGKPLMRGVCLLTTDDEEIINSLPKLVRRVTKHGLVDIGTLPTAHYENILTLFSAGKLRASYVHSMTTVDVDEIEGKVEEKKSEGGQHLVGLLSWRLLYVCYNTVNREEGYIDRHKEKIANFIDLLKVCRDNPESVDDILSAFDRL